MKPGFAPAFRQSLAALFVLASSGCSQVATAPRVPLPATPAPSPAPVAIRTPEPIPPATVQLGHRSQETCVEQAAGGVCGEDFGQCERSA